MMQCTGAAGEAMEHGNERNGQKGDCIRSSEKVPGRKSGTGHFRPSDSKGLNLWADRGKRRRKIDNDAADQRRLYSGQRSFDGMDGENIADNAPSKKKCFLYRMIPIFCLRPQWKK